MLIMPHSAEVVQSKCWRDTVCSQNRLSTGRVVLYNTVRIRRRCNTPTQFFVIRYESLVLTHFLKTFLIIVYNEIISIS
jgi:hypothetical protein